MTMITISCCFRMIDFDPKKRPSAFELLEDPFLLEHAQVSYYVFMRPALRTVGVVLPIMTFKNVR